MDAQSHRFPGVRAHLQQLSGKPEGQSEGGLMARKYQGCIPVSFRCQGAARRSGVPARTSVRDSGDRARRQLDRQELQLFVLAGFAELDDRAVAAFFVLYWMRRRTKEILGTRTALSTVISRRGS